MIPEVNEALNVPNYNAHLETRKSNPELVKEFLNGAVSGAFGLLPSDAIAAAAKHYNMGEWEVLAIAGTIPGTMKEYMNTLDMMF